MHWFYEYLKLIRDGKQVSKLTKKALDRIPHYLNTYEYNASYPNAIIKFIETFIYLQKGGDTSNSPIRLEVEQKFFIELMGFVYPNTHRKVITDIGLILGAGSGKSTFMGALSLAVMIVGSWTGQDVIIYANSKEQAQETFLTAKNMISDERSELYPLAKTGLIIPINNRIKYKPTNSQILVKAMDNKRADGVNIAMAIFDEFHAYDVNIIENVRKSAAPKRTERGFVTWYISTNGQTRDSVFDSYYNRWVKILNGEILNGEIVDDSTFPIIYKLDNLEETKDPKKYEKAMPFVNDISDPRLVYDILQKAKGNPVAQAEILAKSFNIPQKEFNSMFTTEVINKCYKPDVDIMGCDVFVGFDLSAVDDLTSISFLVCGKDGVYTALTHSFIPKETFHKRTKREQRLRYVDFIRAGALEMIDDVPISEERVYNWAYKYIIDHRLNVMGFAGDAYYSKGFKRLAVRDFGEELVNSIPQTVRYLSAPTKILRAKVLDGSLIVGDPVLKWALGNLQVKTDANNNIYPNKSKAKDKIDPAVSLIQSIYIAGNYDENNNFAWG